MKTQNFWSYPIKFLFCYLCVFIVLACVMNSSVSLVISGDLSALASVYLLKVVCLPTFWASLAICQASLQLVCISEVFAVTLCEFLFSLNLFSQLYCYFVHAFWPMLIPGNWWFHWLHSVHLPLFLGGSSIPQHLHFVPLYVQYCNDNILGVKICTCYFKQLLTGPKLFLFFIIQCLHKSGVHLCSANWVYLGLSFPCVLQQLIMKMFFTFISKLHSYWYLSSAFQSNVSCFSAGPSVLGITCFGVWQCSSDYLLLWLPLLLLWQLLWLLVWSMQHVLFCCRSFSFFFLFFFETALFLLLSLSGLRLLPFYFLVYHVQDYFLKLLGILWNRTLVELLTSFHLLL